MPHPGAPWRCAHPRWRGGDRSGGGGAAGSQLLRQASQADGPALAAESDHLPRSEGLGEGNFFTATSEAELADVQRAAAAAGSLLVVDYFAPWCRACVRLLAQMRALAVEDRLRDVLFVSVDFEKSRPLCKAKGLKKLPTLEIYRGEELQERWTGASKPKLLARLDEAIELFGRAGRLPGGGGSTTASLAMSAPRR